ncbi:MAG: hypothetical protein Q9216_007233, partial [Gyalolechia sp. 2 TL-2023]
MSPQNNAGKANIHLRLQRHRGPPTTLLNRQLYPPRIPRASPFNFPNPAPQQQQQHNPQQPPPPTNAPAIVANMGARLTAYRAPPQPRRAAWLGNLAIRDVDDDDDALLARMRGGNAPAGSSATGDTFEQLMARLRHASGRAQAAAARLQSSSDEMRRTLADIAAMRTGVDAG